MKKRLRVEKQRFYIAEVILITLAVTFFWYFMAQDGIHHADKSEFLQREAKFQKLRGIR